MARIAVLNPLIGEAVRATFPDHDVAAVGDGTTAADACAGAEVCVADWSGTNRVTGSLVDALAPTCRLVQVPAAGLDGVDVEACAAAGIPVASCAGLNAATVAEWCVWAAIDALRGLSFAHRSLRDGRWEQLGHVRYELGGKVVGLVGLGDIGRAAAARFAAFGVDLRYWTRQRRPPEVEDDLGVTYQDLDALVREADVLVLAVALAPETRHLLDAARLASMKPSAVVVNAARGGVVDEDALADALAGGRLHGAATDVFASEPPPPDHPLLLLDRAALTPHLAGASVESVVAITQRVFDNVGRVLRGEPPQGLVG